MLKASYLYWLRLCFFFIAFFLNICLAVLLVCPCCHINLKRQTSCALPDAAHCGSLRHLLVAFQSGNDWPLLLCHCGTVAESPQRRTSVVAGNHWLNSSHTRCPLQLCRPYRLLCPDDPRWMQSRIHLLNRIAIQIQPNAHSHE